MKRSIEESSVIVDRVDRQTEDEKLAEIPNQDVASMLNLDSGCEIEVKWDMTCETTGEVTPKWWGALLGKNIGTHTLADEEGEDQDQDPEVCTMFELEYEPFLPDYPEKATHRICFLSDHMLYDVGEDAAQCWRLKGDQWDEVDDDNEEEGAVEHAAAKSNTVEVNSDVSISDASSLLDGLMTALLTKYSTKLASLPRVHQGFVASVVERSRSILSTKIDAFYAEKVARGEDKVMSNSEMMGILAQVSEELEAIKTQAASELA